MTPKGMLALLSLTAFLCLAQSGSRAARRWAIYEREMQSPVEDPPDAWEPAEFAFARLRYRAYRRGGPYQRWGIDSNKSERQFMQGVRRLTRIDARSVEEIVDIDSDSIYDWPFLYAVAVGDWVLTEPQAARLRTFFERGGFMMVDDFHAEREWDNFMAGVKRILAGHAVIDLEDDHPIFHTVYDLSKRVRVPGYNVVYSGQVERGGVNPRWRAVIDEKGRVQIAICFNMDLGDAWEFADDPQYPEQYASMAYRMGVNYILYSLTH
jgi:hypothetical protein